MYTDIDTSVKKMFTSIDIYYVIVAEGIFFPRKKTGSMFVREGRMRLPKLQNKSKGKTIKNSRL